MNTGRQTARTRALLFGVALMCTTPLQVNADPGGTEWANNFDIPGVNGTIHTLLRRGDTLYVGGDVFQFGGSTFGRGWGMMDYNSGRWYYPPWQVAGILASSIYAMAEDAAGNIYMGGDFTTAAGADTISYILKWDGVQVSTLSGVNDQLDGAVNSIEVVGNRIFVGGVFTQAGEGPAEGLAMWSAATGWQEVGGGLFRQGPPVEVHAMEQSGDTLFVGGAFQRTGSRTIRNLGRYELSTDAWLPAWGEPNGTVYALMVEEYSVEWELYVGGDFDSASGIAANNVVRFGSVAGWRTLSLGTNGPVRAFEFVPPAGIMLGGDFTMATGQSVNHITTISRGNSGTFRPMGYGTDGPVYSLLLDDVTNRVVVAGDFELSDSVRTSSLAHLNSSRRQFIATSHGLHGSLSSTRITDMISVNDTIYASGDFPFAGGVPAQDVAMWAPGDESWTRLGPGHSSYIPLGRASSIAAGGGKVYVAGSGYDTTGSFNRTGIRMWNDTTWQHLPGPFVNISSAANARIQCMEVDPVGNLYVGGLFDSVNSVSAKSIAMWDGVQWSDLRGGLDTAVSGGATVADIAWDTTIQSLYVVGQFGTAGAQATPGIAIWSGTDWTGIGTTGLAATEGPQRVEVDDAGNVYVSGRTSNSTSSHTIRKWDGIAFDNVEGATFSAAVYDMQAIGCELYVAGKFLRVNNGSVVANHIARFDGAIWNPLGTGMTADVNALAVSEWAADDIRLYAGGVFSTVDDGIANRISYWHVVKKETGCIVLGKQLSVRDYNGQVLADKTFQLSVIFNDRPDFTESFIAEVVTDAQGRVDISDLLDGGQLAIDDTLRISKLVYTEPSLKHPTLNQYSIELDNMVIDTIGNVHYELVLDSSPLQVVTLDHTTLAFNLVISLEWDATQLFLQNTEACFQSCADFLYDVSDGQMRLDTVYVYDDEQKWDLADMLIYTNNTLRPHVLGGVGGISRRSGKDSRPIEMPRMWTGGSGTRNNAYINHPLDLDKPSSFRTMVHEFGHYALSLKDEYRFVGLFRNEENEDSLRCSLVPNYGFMDNQQSSGGRYASEMSTPVRYERADCQNTFHWRKYEESCWETVEDAYEGTYGGIPVGIYRSDERDRVFNLDFLRGPNDTLNQLSWDAGSRVVFPVPKLAPNATDLKVEFIVGNATDFAWLPAINVWSINATTFRETYQGLTADSGKIWALGVVTPGLIRASGIYDDFTVSPLAAQSSAPVRKWVYAELAVGTADTLHMSLQEVYGNYNLVSRVDPTPGGFHYSMFTSQPFSNTPALEHRVDGLPEDSANLIAASSGYEVTLGDSLSKDGEFRLYVQDDSGATFFFPVRYTLSTPDTVGTFETAGPGGASTLILDSTASSLSQVLISSSPYPVLRTGLDPLAIQAGEAHSVGLLPGGTSPGEHLLTLRYENSDIEAGTGLFGVETQLRVFRWNEVLASWELAGGVVDTAFDEVSVAFVETGTYALFTTDVSTSIGDDPTGSILPDHFELHANWPNPFNPNTTIAYTLATPGLVRLSIYNILGQHVTTVYEGEQAAGEYEVRWNATNKSGHSVASGVYFYRLEAAGRRVTRKMMLLR